MFFFMAPYARAQRLTVQQGSTLMSIINATQIIETPAMGLVADLIGRNILSALLAMIIPIQVFAFWINAKTFPSLV
jgi:hypothetical protein